MKPDYIYKDLKVILQKGKAMNKSEFLNYLEDNYSISGEAFRLIRNILDYAENFYGDEQYNVLCTLLDGTIGLSDSEIKKINL